MNEEQTEAELIADLKAQVADANRCAAQALADRDMLRNQWFQMEREARDLQATSPLAMRLQHMLDCANNTAKMLRMELDASKMEVRLLRKQLRLAKQLKNG